MRSLRLRTTDRLSFSEVAAGMCNSMRTMPTNIWCRSARGLRRAGRCLGLQAPGEFLDRERLDDVAFVNVAHALEADTALEAGADFPDVVLESPQRRDPSGPHRRSGADQTHPGRARDGPAGDHAAGD